MSAKPTLKMMRDAGVDDSLLQLCNSDINSENKGPKTLARILPIKAIKGIYPYRGSICLLYTSPSTRDATLSAMASSA